MLSQKLFNDIFEEAECIYDPRLNEKTLLLRAKAFYNALKETISDEMFQKFWKNWVKHKDRMFAVCDAIAYADLRSCRYRGKGTDQRTPEQLKDAERQKRQIPDDYLPPYEDN